MLIYFERCEVALLFTCNLYSGQLLAFSTSILCFYYFFFPSMDLALSNEEKKNQIWFQNMHRLFVFCCSLFVSFYAPPKKCCCFMLDEEGVDPKILYYWIIKLSPFSNFWFPDLLILSFLISLFLWLVFTSFLTCEKVLCFSVFRGVHSRVWTKLYVQLFPGYFCLFFM